MLCASTSQFVSAILSIGADYEMNSICKPKRLTIREDDEKEYMFLVKGGEDLRMDQRIEQVLS